MRPCGSVSQGRCWSAWSWGSVVQCSVFTRPAWAALNKGFSSAFRRCGLWMRTHAVQGARYRPSPSRGSKPVPWVPCTIHTQPVDNLGYNSVLLRQAMGERGLSEPLSTSHRCSSGSPSTGSFSCEAGAGVFVSSWPGAAVSAGCGSGAAAVQEPCLPMLKQKR